MDRSEDGEFEGVEFDPDAVLWVREPAPAAA